MITGRRSPTARCTIEELLTNFNANEQETVSDKSSFECFSCPKASTVFNTKKKVDTKVKEQQLGDFSTNIKFSKQRDQGWCSMTKNEKQNVS